MTNAPYYMDELDLSGLPEDLRLHLGKKVVPSLLNEMSATGIEVFVEHDLNTIQRVQEKHPRKPRLFEIGNPKFQPSANAADTFVVLMRRNGEDVGVVCCRLKWIESTLADAFQQQTLLFESPAMAGDSAFVVKAPQAYRVEAVPIVVTTGLCVMPSEDKVVMKTIVRLAHLMATVRWQWNRLVALCTPKFAAHYPFEVEGYSSIFGGVAWNRDGEWKEYRLVMAERSYLRRLIGSLEFADLSGSLGMPVTGGVPCSQLTHDPSPRPPAEGAP